MEAKNLSIAVPGGCPNKCPFCVAEQHENVYPSRYKGYMADWVQRLSFAANQGVSSVLLTGTGEPLSNMEFLKMFAEVNAEVEKSFDWVELQTSGVGLNGEFEGADVLPYLKHKVRVSTIALSVCDIFSPRNNASIMGIPEDKYYDLNEMCAKIKENGFNLRLSLNMTDVYNTLDIEQIFEMASCLGADQLTFRKMFNIGDGGKEDTWIGEHLYTKWDDLIDYIENEGTPLNRLSFGPMKYSVNGMSTVADWDCMSTTGNETAVVRSLILRPNCKLYTHWGDKGSLIF